MIEIQQLTKSYENVTALSIQHLHIAKNEIVGLVGNNGAGKTTLLSLLLDLIEADSGKALLYGENVKGSEHWKIKTGSFLNEDFLIPFLKPIEYLKLTADLKKVKSVEFDAFMEKHKDFLGSENINSNKYISELSQGNKAKVGIMAACLGKPKVVLLDEPFAHLDPSSQNRLKKMIEALNHNEGTTFIISSHDLKHITDLCLRIILIENGNILMDQVKNESSLSELENYFEV